MMTIKGCEYLFLIDREYFWNIALPKLMFKSRLWHVQKSP
jgi:hypothetical protein